MEPLTIACWTVFGVYGILALVFFVTSLLERELRATGVTLAAFAPFAGLFLFVLHLDGEVGTFAKLSFAIVTTVPVLLLIAVKTKSAATRVVGEQTRVDERDAVFHRFRRLVPGTPEFDKYYKTHPDKVGFDKAVRAMPHMEHPEAKSYNPLATPMMASTFTVIEEISRDIEWQPHPLGDAPVEASGEELAKRIKGFAKYLGAVRVGCTALNPAYVYSHIGRSPGKWGARIDLNHKNAIAIAVPMEHDMVRHAPDLPECTETGFEYLEAGKIAMVLAKYINLLGYEARAHVDANYRVMCVPIAADAGIGELGRLGLLIAPTYGPRIRLSVVTTNIDLAHDAPISFGVQDFCTFCKKCADICPSGSVDKGDKAVYKGVEKWQTHQDSCYRYWRMVGTDCGLCMKVCPYSHQSNPVHNGVRWLISRNHVIRRAALLGDDLAYGRTPSRKYPWPEWHKKSE